MRYKYNIFAYMYKRTTKMNYCSINSVFLAAGNGLFILDARDIDKFLKQTVSNSSELISHGIFLPVKGWDHQ